MRVRRIVLGDDSFQFFRQVLCSSQIAIELAFGDVTGPSGSGPELLNTSKPSGDKKPFVFLPSSHLCTSFQELGFVERSANGFIAVAAQAVRGSTVCGVVVGSDSWGFDPGACAARHGVGNHGVDELVFLQGLHVGSLRFKAARAAFHPHEGRPNLPVR